MDNFLQLFLPKRLLGIDIGTSFVKMVELSKFGSRVKLENYGSLSAQVFYQKPFRTFEKSTLSLSSHDIGRAISAIMEETKIKTKQAVFSIPDFSTFFTNFEIPQMTREEVSQAVRYEARQHIPVPLSEVTLDWQVVDGRSVNEKKANFKILLVAVPNEIINQYQQIAQLAQLELVALEAEVFSLIRALIKKEEKGAVGLIDIGAQSTTCSIVEKQTLKMSHSFDMSGDDLTTTLAKSLNIDFAEADGLKRKYGVADASSEAKNQNIKEILLPLFDIILREVEVTFRNFYQQERKEVEKVIMAGGTALVPGVKEYFKENLKKTVEVGNPFINVFYPPILEKSLGEMGPAFAIAMGAALRGLE